MKMRKLVETVLAVFNKKENDLWHFENPDTSPLCRRPKPLKWWTHGALPNGYGMKTTENVKYVTCKRCLEILKERGIVVNESA